MNSKCLVNSRTTLIVITVLLFAAYSCDSTDDSWLTTIYPNKENLAEYQNLGPYLSIDTCRQAAAHNLQINGWEETGTYECGLNCTLDVYAEKMFICEDTTQ